MPIGNSRTWRVCLLGFLLLVSLGPSARAQGTRSKLDGMWSDPPQTAVGTFCFAWCTDAGIDYLNKLLDNPANDVRPFEQLMSEADRYQRQNYIRSRLTDAAAKAYPQDPADDPAFLQCKPYGLGHQMLARHQLEIRQRGNDRIELRYGEWDARRTAYLDGRRRPPTEAPTLLGYSVGRWEGETLVIETAGIKAGLMFGSDGAKHSDQLKTTERYTRSQDGKTLLLTATFEDPLSLREPVVLKKIWSWAPGSEIAPYKDCQRPDEFSKSGKRP